MEQDKYMKKIISKIKHRYNQIKKLNNNGKDEAIKIKILQLFFLLCLIAILPIYSWCFGLDIYYKLFDNNQYQLAEKKLMSLYQHSNYWFGENNDNTLLLLEELASLNRYKKNYEKCYIYYTKAVSLREKYNKLNNSWGIESLKGLTTCYLEKKQYKKAIYYGEKALILSNELGEKKITDKLLSLINLQKIYIRIGNEEKLNDIFDDLTSLSNTFKSPKSEYYNNYVYAIVSHYIYFKRYKKAKHLLSEAIKQNNNKKNKNFYLLNKIFLMKLLANTYEKEKNYKLAEKTYKDVLFMTEDEFGKDSLIEVHLKKDLALFYLRNNEAEKSKQILINIAKLENKYLDKVSPERMCTYYYISKVSLEKTKYLNNAINLSNQLKKIINRDISLDKFCIDRNEPY